jgi:hypothetical protein
VTQFLWARLKEPSTWASICGLLIAYHVNSILGVNVAQLQQTLGNPANVSHLTVDINMVFTGISGLLGIFLAEKGQAAPVKPDPAGPVSPT